MRRLFHAHGWPLLAALALTSPLGGCASSSGRARVPTTASPLALDRVVLYRNGVGYFERRGEVDGNVLRLKVRKDQVNDLLKSLTIVDRQTGRALSVSMPLDPDTWATAALRTLNPGRGNLAVVIDLLRGADVELDTTLGGLEGRIVMVEEIIDEPDPTQSAGKGRDGTPALGRDHKVTLMDGTELKVVRLSKVKGVTLKDGDLAMQFHRRLDATAGEGMFQQVEIAIRLEGAETHDLTVSYVVEAPMWKPTYRVVLPEDGKGEALLQAWAVVDNTSGEDWGDVRLSLTAGAPIAFRYDLHTPRRVFREDLSERVGQRRTRVAMGETSYEEVPEEPMAQPEPEVAAAMPTELGDGEGYGYGLGSGRGGGGKKMDKSPRRSRSKPSPRPKLAEERTVNRYYGDDDEDATLDNKPGVSFEGLRRSTQAQARAAQAAGLTRFDLEQPVTVPDGNSTMVAIVNQAVKGEEAFLFDPRGGGGSGYEKNPFRVVRFKNTTPFVLEPGPISIYSAGSFVGEGISETVGSGSSATVPFAVEPTIMVDRKTDSLPEELKLVKISRGVLEVERFHRVETTWHVQAQTKEDGFKVLIRHPRYGDAYKLKDRPNDTEDLVGAYLIPVSVPQGKRSATIELVEQTPSRTTISLLDERVLPMLERFLAAGNISAGDRAKLEPVIAKRRELGKAMNEISARRRRLSVLERQMNQARANLERLKDMKGAEAAKMAAARARKLEDWTKEHDEIGREVLTLEEKREQLEIQLDEMLQGVTIGG